ncbi:trans-sulfuration enzyme family protein [Flocculibacter collagenilyticus]|uniref:trans-sulfuration enzyme family protein n=1 Tax=Flocculibacter collagenilyticus TaxID=2744479 RepID=UPI0018F56598|nr:aminotransferase class I/II-fold pyridoxal phosphate-dependent enzyme [Flocculibacter collagenilyticus]
MTIKKIIKGDHASHSSLTQNGNKPSSTTEATNTINTNASKWANDLTRSRVSGPMFPRKNTESSAHQTDVEAPWQHYKDATRAVHAGSFDDVASGAVGTPIYQSSTFLLGEEQYQSIDEGHARDRFIYTRYGNPTLWAVQNKLAALENAESALVFSSGMAAITASVMALVDRGAHIIASNELYGGTYNLFNYEFPSFGMSASYVNPRDYTAIEAAIKPNTQLMFFEALTNPLLKLIDIERLADIAKRNRIRLIIDATFVTPIGLKSLALGADLVVHSASKYLNGHSDLIAGCVMGSRKLVDMVWPRMLTYGGSMDPHAAFLLERGLKTLPIRMQAHEKSAFALAQYLEAHPKVKRVIYPKLPSYPDYSLAKRILKTGTGMITFELTGGDQAALQLVKHLSIPKEATSLGGVESLISLPFNTSQAGFTANQRKNMGINPGCVRLSVGIEDPEDLIADFATALSLITTQQTNPATADHRENNLNGVSQS